MELGFGAGGRTAPGVVPDPELVEQAKRRNFTAEYKARVLAEADAKVEVIRELAGHADIRTTSIYTDVSEERLELAIADSSRQRRGAHRLADL